MAVPKKKTSNSKRNSRRSHWNRKGKLAAQKALSQGKSILTDRAEGFYYPVKEKEDEDE